MRYCPPTNVVYLRSLQIFEKSQEPEVLAINEEEWEKERMAHNSWLEKERERHGYKYPHWSKSI